MNGGAEINVNELLDTLDNMIPGLFERLLLKLDVPLNLMLSSDKPQTERVTKLLEWAKAPGGCGLEKIKQVGVKLEKLSPTAKWLKTFPGCTFSLSNHLALLLGQSSYSFYETRTLPIYTLFSFSEPP